MLAHADKVIRSRWLALQAHYVCQGWRLRARFDYPGRLSVFDANTGELMVESRNGHPTRPRRPASKPDAA
jgi:PQQ enzyme repeat